MRNAIARKKDDIDWSRFVPETLKLPYQFLKVGFDDLNYSIDEYVKGGALFWEPLVELYSVLLK